MGELRFRNGVWRGKGRGCWQAGGLDAGPPAFLQTCRSAAHPTRPPLTASRPAPPFGPTRPPRKKASGPTPSPLLAGGVKGRFGFFRCVYGRQTNWFKSKSENLPVEKEYGVERLVLSRGRDLPLDGQRREEGFDFGLVDLEGVPLVVEEDKPPNPMDIRFAVHT